VVKGKMRRTTTLERAKYKWRTKLEKGLVTKKKLGRAILGQNPFKKVPRRENGDAFSGPINWEKRRNPIRKRIGEEESTAETTW